MNYLGYSGIQMKRYNVLAFRKENLGTSTRSYSQKLHCMICQNAAFVTSLNVAIFLICSILKIYKQNAEAEDESKGKFSISAGI